MFRASCSSSLLKGNDEQETLRCSNPQICPTRADVRQTKDLELQADGTVRGLIRRSQADQLGFGRTVYGSKRSGDLLSEWLEAREFDTPWLFCPVRHGFAYDRPLSTSQVKNIIKAAAQAAGVEGDGSGEVSGHSLRVGAA